MYALTFKSHKPAAKRFRKWVNAEVLPAIRKSGSYGAVDIPDFKNPATAARAWVEQFEANEATRVKAERQAPPAP